LPSSPFGQCAFASRCRLAKMASSLHQMAYRYNWHRFHGGPDSKPPISRLGLAGNNLLRLRTWLASARAKHAIFYRRLSSSRLTD
jgi:hypothetical protein